MSGRCKRSCRSNSASACTTTAEPEKPPLRRAWATSSASSLLSSMCSTRSSLGWGASHDPALVSVMSRACQMLETFHYGRLIDDQPVQSDCLDRLPELIEVNWFLDIAVGPQVVTGHQVPLFFRRGHDDDGDNLSPRVTLDLFEHFHPIDFRQFQVQQDQLGGMFKRSLRERPATKDKVQSFLAIARHEDVVRQFFPPQRVQGKVYVVLTVFRQQYVHSI